MTHLLSLNGTTVNATALEADAIDTLMDTRKGGCASVIGYKPSTNWTVAPTQNIQFLSRISTAKLYARRKAALEALTLSDVAESIAAEPKLAAMSLGLLNDLFIARRDMEVASIVKTQDGNRDDAHRQGHDRCYVNVTEGVKVNLVTVKGDDGLKHPVLAANGFPTIASIMVSALFLNTTTTQQGVRKVVNSGPAVLMSNAIAKAMNKPTLSLKMLSLKADNFTALKIDRETILAEDIHELVA